MVAGRHTYIERSRTPRGTTPVQVYDVARRLNLDVGENDRTSLSLFRGTDRLDLSRETWTCCWTGGTTPGPRSGPRLQRRVFSHFLLGGSRFHSDGKVAFQDFEFKQENRIEDLSAKGAVSFRPSTSTWWTWDSSRSSWTSAGARTWGTAPRWSSTSTGSTGAVRAGQLEGRARTRRSSRAPSRLLLAGGYTGLGPA